MPPDRPDVLVICCDDLGYGDLGCYGAEYDTPNIDALADEGVRFTDWHSNSPVCSPSRASLLTGRYPQCAGVPANVPSARPESDPDIGLPLDVPTLADVLGDAGYRTGAFGKWHLGATERDDAIAHGFDRFFGFRSGCVDYYSHTFMWRQHDGVAPYHDLWDDREEVWRNGEYTTDLISDAAVEFVTDADEPFFCYVAYNAPHYPMHAPAHYLDRFPDLPPERRIVAAMVAAVDDGVGAILDALDRRGVADDTVVVFTSDHGPSREIRNHLDGSDDPFYGGSTGGHRGHKFSLFEGGIRVPGIVRYPAVVDGDRTTDELAMSMDVLPTVLDTAGIDGPETDGASLMGVLAERNGTPHYRVYWSFNDQLAVIDGDWKLVLGGREVASDPPPVHLANLEDDPEERNNVAGAHRELVDELERDVRAWRDRVSQ